MMVGRVPDPTSQQMETAARKEWARSGMQVSGRSGRDSAVWVSSCRLMGMNLAVMMSSAVLESYLR